MITVINYISLLVSSIDCDYSKNCNQLRLPHVFSCIADLTIFFSLHRGARTDIRPKCTLHAWPEFSHRWNDRKLRQQWEERRNFGHGYVNSHLWILYYHMMMFYITSSLHSQDFRIFVSVIHCLAFYVNTRWSCSKLSVLLFWAKWWVNVWQSLQAK